MGPMFVRGAGVFVVVAALAAAACGRSSAPEPPVLSVFAAISLTEPLDQLADQFKARTGVTVRLNLSGSNTLATQIVNGGPADVFVSADEAQMDRVAAAGLVDSSRRVRLLSNRLVVIVSSTSSLAFSVPADLAAPSVKRFAMADPAAVPAGRYASAYLRARGVWPSLESRLVYFPHVRAVSTAIAQGAADAAIVYRTDARVATGTRVLLEIDEDPRWAIVYPAAVLQRAPHAEAARAFVTFLQEPASLEVFEAAGFVAIHRASSI
jgi:molybdate transport system substrate-binding protein